MDILGILDPKHCSKGELTVLLANKNYKIRPTGTAARGHQVKCFLEHLYLKYFTQRSLVSGVTAVCQIFFYGGTDPERFQTKIFVSYFAIDLLSVLWIQILFRIQDFCPIWIRIRIQGYNINFERKN